jgi:putative aldouronate transport system permease protein
MTTLVKDPRDTGTKDAPKPRKRGAGGVSDSAGPAEKAIKAIALIVICGAVIVPFIGVISTSLAPPDQVNDAGGFVLLPKGIDLTAYKSILTGGVVTQALLISALVTLVGTALSLLVTTLLAWALSRKGTVGNHLMLMLVLFSLLFTPGLMPTYLVVKQFGLIDSLWSLILPTVISAFNVIVVRSFFVTLPDELTDAAKIDGASEWGIFRRIALPLSKAPLAVVGLFYGVGYWNAFFNAVLYINDASKWPLQLVLRTYVVDRAQLSTDQLGALSEAAPPQTTVQMAILIISIVPILIVYPFLQRHFTKGVLTGAVKG